MAWVRDYDPLRYGQPVEVTIEDVTAEATFIGGYSTRNGSLYMVRLAGTGEIVSVPGWVVKPKA